LGTLLSVGCHQLFDLERVAHDSVGSGSDGGANSDATTQAKVVFLTSVFKTGAMGGLAGADAHCQTLAAAAQLPGEYMAWLSTSTASPASRMAPATVPYALVGGAVIADDWDDLVDGKLKTPILLTETGNGPPESPFICQGSEVWSNTKVDGTVSAGGSCTNWTVTTGTGDASRSTTSGAFWTESECPNINCGIALPFYCFQQ
jgi:hypothetical protein